MDKTYDPHRIEQYWYEHWEERGYFSPDTVGRNTDGASSPYCIMIPPPNVTGTLAYGPRVSAHHHGCVDALSPYDAADDTTLATGDRSRRYCNPDGGGTAVGSRKE